MMIIARRGFAAWLTVLGLVIGCDGGSPSRTADEFAADSALAADLALANRDTLLVDSIGAFRPPESGDSLLDLNGDSAVATAAAPSADFSDVTAPPPRVADAAPPVSASRAPAPRASPSPPSPAPAPAPAPAPSPAPAPASSGPRLSGTRACASPTLENQSECLRTLLPAADARLNRIYRALITEMRLQEKVRPGARDPASVQRLRVAQRAWLVYRDNECRRRGRGKEGARWARPRVRCLGQFANRRANELADNFSRLTAR